MPLWMIDTRLRAEIQELQPIWFDRQEVHMRGGYALHVAAAAIQAGWNNTRNFHAEAQRLGTRYPLNARLATMGLRQYDSIYLVVPRPQESGWPPLSEQVQNRHTQRPPPPGGDAAGNGNPNSQSSGENFAQQSQSGRSSTERQAGGRRQTSQSQMQLATPWSSWNRRDRPRWNPCLNPWNRQAYQKPYF